MARITAEICENRHIHGKVTASTVKSEHESEASTCSVAFLYHLHFGQRNKQYQQQLKGRNVKLMITLVSRNKHMHTDC